MNAKIAAQTLISIIYLLMATIPQMIVVEQVNKITPITEEINSFTSEMLLSNNKTHIKMRLGQTYELYDEMESSVSFVMSMFRIINVFSVLNLFFLIEHIL
mmetsp:Transcript_12333/g.19139  ORF Transcript_12333/g.19139 Transcript_12333/m.19139 type:complete len:101 (-) Transcript_12333:1491-1793(-)